MKCLRLHDYRAKAHSYRKGLTYLKYRASTSQNKTLHSQQMRRNVLKNKINENHSTKKRKEEWRILESTGKQGLKWQ